jgi:hypothetical protein
LLNLKICPLGGMLESVSLCHSKLEHEQVIGG